jgi:hypothetical protein
MKAKTGDQKKEKLVDTSSRTSPSCAEALGLYGPGLSACVRRLTEGAEMAKEIKQSYLKDEVWGHVSEILEEEYQARVNRDDYDEELQDIKDSIERLAARIQEDIDEAYRNAEPDAHCPVREHNLV